MEKSIEATDENVTERQNPAGELDCGLCQYKDWSRTQESRNAFLWALLFLGQAPLPSTTNP